ncbi:B3 domain-containing transcription factor VRN1 [Linum grandiflorum]
MAEKAAAGPRFYTSILATDDPKLKVVLKLPSGAEWQVKVARRGRKMWFDEGWREFAEFYFIAPDHLLAFEFDGHGNCLVFIFAQMVYRTQQLEQADVHVKVECEEAESLPSPKRRAKPPFQPPPSKQRRTLNSEHRRGECIRDEGYHQDVDLGGASQKRKLMMTYDGEEETSCLARATAAFKSENPFIMKVMQPSYLTTGNKVVRMLIRLHTTCHSMNHCFPITRVVMCISLLKSQIYCLSLLVFVEWQLYVRATFFLKNFKENSGHMFLHVLGGKTWTVEYSVYENRVAVFTAKTWGTFARDNGLKVGDVCAFEVLKGQTKKPALNVVIFRAHQGVHPDDTHQDVHPDTQPNSTGLQLDDRENAPNDQVKLTKRSLESGDMHRSGNARKQSNQILHSSGGLEAANAFTSDVPFFKKTIPTKFHKHIGYCRDAELWFKGKCRGVRIVHDGDLRGRTHPRKYMSSGWKDFAVPNSLKQGDICIFELVKGEANDGDDISRRSIDMVTLLVHVFRR